MCLQSDHSCHHQRNLKRLIKNLWPGNMSDALYESHVFYCSCRWFAMWDKHTTLNRSISKLYINTELELLQPGVCSAEGWLHRPALCCVSAQPIFHYCSHRTLSKDRAGNTQSHVSIQTLTFHQVLSRELELIGVSRSRQLPVSTVPFQARSFILYLQLRFIRCNEMVCAWANRKCTWNMSTKPSGHTHMN